MTTHTGQSISLQPYAGKLRTVSAQLGFQPISLLLDTGGGQTLLTPKAAQRLGLQPCGRSISYRMNGEQVSFEQRLAGPLVVGPLFNKKLKIGIFNLDSLLPPGLPEVDGILALDVFSTNPFSLHMAENHLIFESPISLAPRLEGLKTVHIQTATGMDGNSLTIFVPCQTKSGQEAWFLLDSANLDAILIDRHLRPEFDIYSGGTQAVLQFGGASPEPYDVSVRPLIYDGVLNAEFFEKHLLTFDLERKQMWIR